LTVRLKQALGPVPRDVSFGDFQLVREGKGVCRVLPSGGAGLLTKGLPELADEGRQKALPADAPAVLAGTLQDSPALREVVRRHLGEEITAHYPRPGRYAIRIVPASGTTPRTLVLVGGDREGTEKGARHLLRLLTVEN